MSQGWNRVSFVLQTHVVFVASRLATCEGMPFKALTSGQHDPCWIPAVCCGWLSAVSGVVCLISQG
jgi:hypothetical protein